MSLNFASPSHRAGQSDLTIQISPLGLVELSDEEFEVHGPRLNRYATHWGWYLGHHWSHRREMGEPQVTVNYVRAFADYKNNFCFGQGVRFKTPKATEAIVPPLLQRIWEVDNSKLRVLWEMGNQGGISGDCFVKVAYEEPYEDVTGRYHEGKVRLLVLNAAHCFPEWHPHDRNRLTRFKLKYRFWGTAAEGTRQVFTYTEIITDEEIAEYVNDEEIDRRPNPLGTIPVVHIANIPVTGSPWGLSDVQDITNLNREYNEKATDVSDIINYHAEPVTVITGAKVSQLEKGSKKVWGGLPSDAKVFNLELGANLAAPIAYMEMLKRSMHELTGVPETALGQAQPISNTSGVALAIQFQPLMNHWHLKRIQYGDGIERINELALMTLFLKEPWTLLWDPTQDTVLKQGQLQVLDPADPVTYRTECFFPPPLPLDVLVKLSELGQKMEMGLESRVGALRELGEEFPESKLDEIQRELMDDAKRQGALDMVRAHVMAAIATATGMLPDGSAPEPGAPGGPPASADAAGGDGAGPGRPAYKPPAGPIQDMLEEMTVQAYVPRLSRRNPDADG